MILPVLLAFSFLQRPISETPAARAARLEAFDSSKAALHNVGMPIAEVKSALDVYRRAVFNGTDQEVLDNARYLRASCLATDTTARRMIGQVCRHCARGEVQAAFDGYRQMLPTLRRGMQQCAGRLSQLERGSDAAKQLRHDVRAVGNPLVTTLRFYEARLGALLKVLNITHSPPPPPRQPGAAGR
ncbi:MAG TPA: hypothetical protein VEH62_06170 [Gemmatimonadales bacterium]|nr:hypothetical protein [Gemmatimonadales bacterium]